MRICIDVSQIVYGTGVSVYTKNLVQNLLKIDQKNEYVFFAGTLRRKADVLRLVPGAKVFPIPPTLADIIWNRTHVLPIEKLVGKIDVFHSSDWTQPPSNAFKVTTVHDLYLFKFPKLISPLVREVHKRRLWWIIKEVDRIIVPSESTKADLISIGGSAEKIRVIPEAPSMSMARPEEIERIRKKYQLSGDYLISIGISKLKNTQAMIKAFHLATAGKNLKLVLVGDPKGVEIPSERNIRILGHVPQEDLSALLTGSKGLLFASLYEGYGIPILDAFACQVPVVTSNLASMPEVAGDAAALVDPKSIDSIREGIEKIVRGPKSFVDKGTKRVAEFSWEKTAEETIKVYEEVKL